MTASPNRTGETGGFGYRTLRRQADVIAGARTRPALRPAGHETATIGPAPFHVRAVRPSEVLQLQRMAGNRAVSDLLSAGAKDHLILQRAVDTAGGRWDTTEYRSIPIPGGSDRGTVGAAIALEFMPNALVDSPRIALIQSVRSRHRGEVVAHPTNPSVGAGEHAGARIDNDQFAQSPIYIEDASAINDAFFTNPEMGAIEMGRQPGLQEAISVSSLADVKAQPETGGYGSAGSGRAQKAWLKDEPLTENVAVAAPASGEFEVTAVSLRGEQEGVYYGTVRWGWTKPANERRVDLIPLGVVKYGGMSGMLRAAAAVWNQANNRNPFTRSPRLKLVVPPPNANDLTDPGALDANAIRTRLNAIAEAYPFYSGWLSSRAAEVNVGKRNALFEQLYLKKLLDELERRGEDAARH